MTGTGEVLGRPHAIDLAQRIARVAPDDRGGSNKEGVDAYRDMDGFRCANSHNFLAGSGVFAISEMLQSGGVGLLGIEQP